MAVVWFGLDGTAQKKIAVEKVWQSSFSQAEHA